MSKKMCKLYKKSDKEKWKEYKDLSKNPKHICKSCGRVSAKSSNLCKSEKL